MRTTMLTLALCLVVGVAFAQSAAPEARSRALAGAYGARATGYEASFWNPANLGLSTSPAWSAGSSANVLFYNNALGYSDVTDLYGEFLDDATKRSLLADVRDATGGGQARMDFEVGAQAFGASFGRFAIGFSGSGAGNAEITPDALELLLFGNVGEDGLGRDFDFDGTRADVWTLSSLHASYAQPFTIPALPLPRFAAGVTLRIGNVHQLVRVTETTSALIYDPLQLDVAMQKLQSDGSAGSVFAADLGVAMQWGGRATFGVSLANAIQSLDLDASAFEFTDYVVDADYESVSVDNLTLPYGQLDAAGKARVDAMLDDVTLPRILRLGSLWNLSPRADLSVDYVEQIGGALRSGWERSLSVGGELHALPLVPLRAGLATDFDQFGLTAGLGLHAGPAHLDLAIGRWGLGGGDGITGAVALSFWP